MKFLKFIITVFLVNAMVFIVWGRPQALFAERPLPGGPQREIANGVFLVADPRLVDPNFNKTVVLVIHHGLDGTLGLIINRPTTTALSRLLPEVKQFQGHPDTLYIGGPVLQKVLLLLFRSTSGAQSNQVLDDVYFSQDMNALADALGQKDQTAFRVYAGYAGWASGQLQNEFDRGDWRVIRADADAIFKKDPETLWPEMLRRSSEQLIKELGRPGLSSSGPS